MDSVAKNGVFVAAFAVSVAANVKLLGWPASARARSAALSDSSSSALTRSGSDGRVRAPLLAPQPERRQAATQNFEACRQEVWDLQERINRMHRQLQRLMTPKEAFEQATRDPSAAPLVERELRSHLQARDDAQRSDVECHGVVCRASRDRDAESGGPELEREWARARIRGTMATRDAVYFSLRDANVASGVDILQRAVSDFSYSGAIERCRNQFHDQGTLELRIDLAAKEDETDDVPAFSFRQAGQLTGTALGECMTAALQRALQSVVLPPAYDGASIPIRWP